MVKNYIDLAANVETDVNQISRVDFDSESDMEVPPFCGLMVGILFTGRLGRFSHGYRGFLCSVSPCLLSNSFGAG